MHVSFAISSRPSSSLCAADVCVQNCVVYTESDFAVVASELIREIRAALARFIATLIKRAARECVSRVRRAPYHQRTKLRSPAGESGGGGGVRKIPVALWETGTMLAAAWHLRHLFVLSHACAWVCLFKLAVLESRFSPRLTISCANIWDKNYYIADIRSLQNSRHEQSLVFVSIKSDLSPHWFRKLIIECPPVELIFESSCTLEQLFFFEW